MLTHGTLLRHDCWECSSPSPFGQSGLSTSNPPWPPQNKPKRNQRLTSHRDTSLCCIHPSTKQPKNVYDSFLFKLTAPVLAICDLNKMNLQRSVLLVCATNGLCYVFANGFVVPGFLGVNAQGRNMDVLWDDSELLPDPEDRLTDVRRWVVLDQHQHFVVWTCQKNSLMLRHRHHRLVVLIAMPNLIGKTTACFKLSGWVGFVTSWQLGYQEPTLSCTPRKIHSWCSDTS